MLSGSFYPCEILQHVATFCIITDLRGYRDLHRIFADHRGSPLISGVFRGSPDRCQRPVFCVCVSPISTLRWRFWDGFDVLICVFLANHPALVQVFISLWCLRCAIALCLGHKSGSYFGKPYPMSEFSLLELPGNCRTGSGQASVSAGTIVPYRVFSSELEISQNTCF